MKRIAAALVSILMLVSLCVPVFAATDSAATGDDYTPQDAQLYVKSVKNSIVKAGEVMEFPLEIGSRSGYSAYEVRMSLKGAGDYADGFVFWGQSSWFSAGQIVGSSTVKPQIWVDPKVPDGRYELQVSFQYTDGRTAFDSQDTITVTVYGRSSDLPYVQSAKFNVDEIDNSNKAKMTVSIVNPMADPIWDVNVTFRSSGSDGFSLYENFLPVELSHIESGKTAAASFSVYVTQSTGNYPVSFDISYMDVNNNVHTVTQTIWVEVNRAAGAGTENASRPRIIIQSYQTDVEAIEAGKEFTLNFTLENTSASEAVSNIKVVLGSVSSGSSQSGGSSEVFFPSAGSNSFFVEQIAPKGTSAHSIKLMTSQNVEPGVYPVMLDISYDSESATNLNSSEQISFPVTQQQRLEIQNFMAGSDTMEGSPVQISGQYINMGKSTIYNFSIGVDGPFTMMEGYGGYVGNLSSGYNDYLDLMVTPTQTGECLGAIVFSYEDSQGNPKSDRYEFTVNVSPMDMGGGSDMMGGDGMMGGNGMTFDPETGYLVDASGQMYDPITMEPVSAGLPLWAVIAIAAGGVVIVAAVVTTIVMVRKKRRAKDLVDDEED